MPAGKKFDARMDSLVMETKTLWDPGVADQLTQEEKSVIAEEIHLHPELASKIEYERAHTGFTRIITVTEDDIARLYEKNIAAE